MKGSLFTLGIGFLLMGSTVGGRSAAPETGPIQSPSEAIQKGHALARHLRNMIPIETIRGVFHIRRPNGKRSSIPLSIETESLSKGWQTVYMADPPQEQGQYRLTIRHEEDKSPVYCLESPGAQAGTFDSPRTLDGDEAMVPFAATDFWLSDLGMEFLHWPMQRVVNRDMRRGRACWVLESINTSPDPTGYARVVSWIDIETNGPVLIRAYNKQGELLKEFKPEKVTKVDGEWRVEELEIRNQKTDSRTTLVFELE